MSRDFPGEYIYTLTCGVGVGVYMPYMQPAALLKFHVIMVYIYKHGYEGYDQNIPSNHVITVIFYIPVDETIIYSHLQDLGAWY